MLAVVEELADRAVDFETLLEELLAALHQMAVSHATDDSAQLPFDAETVQLLYQIALMGYRDLSITPDPRSGVEMTLLRMLSFGPDERSTRVPPISSAGAGDGEANSEQSTGAAAPPASEMKETTASARVAADPVSAPRSQPVLSEPAASERPAAEPAAVDPGPAAEKNQPNLRRAEATSPWHDLLETLDLGGVSRMIAEHSIARQLSAEAVHLILDPAHDTLLGEAQIRMIQRALDGHFGQAVSFHIETGEIDVETPADRRARMAAERQADAEQLLEGSDQVKNLLSEFGGRLDEVQPLDAEDQRQSGGAGR